MLAPQPPVSSAETDGEGIWFIKEGPLGVLYHIDPVFAPHLTAINFPHQNTSQIKGQVDFVDLLPWIRGTGPQIL